MGSTSGKRLEDSSVKTVPTILILLVLTFSSLPSFPIRIQPDSGFQPDSNSSSTSGMPNSSTHTTIGNETPGNSGTMLYA